MRIFKINDTNIDIDEQTAIGITLQTYDIKEPGKRKVIISNSFTIPLTSNNLNVIGYAGNNQFTSNTVYDSFICNYWINNEHLIVDARLRVDEVGERISVFVFQKNDVWDQLKLFSWEDFVSEFVAFLYAEKGYPSAYFPFSGNFGEFMDIYKDETEGLIIPMYFGNLYNYEPGGEGTGYLEDETNIWLKYHPDTADNPSNGGHICAYIKTIFEFIEYKYDVNFLVNEVSVTGNIWDDVIADNLYTPIRDIDVSLQYSGATVTGYFFDIIDYDGSFSPEKTELKDKGGKTLYDLVNSFFQLLNIIKDDIYVDGERAIRLSRFDDIIDNAEVVKFSGKIQGKPKFKPYIDGFKQENIIKFKEIYPEGDELIGSRVIKCNNLNLDATQDLFTIDAYIPSLIAITGDAVPDLSIKESFKTFVFLISVDTTTDVITISVSDDSASEETATAYLEVPEIYGIADEYQLMDDILDKPIFYEIEKWLTLTDIKDFEFYKQYYIQELNGSYFINKISGFNPQKSNSPTKIEVIKISNSAVIDFIDLQYWTDGIADIYTDGLNDEYF